MSISISSLSRPPRRNEFTRPDRHAACGLTAGFSKLFLDRDERLTCREAFEVVATDVQRRRRPRTREILLCRRRDMVSQELLRRHDDIFPLRPNFDYAGLIAKLLLGLNIGF
jgi:hypothetical protein